MLGHFPRLYPDELLYSAFARLAERMDFPAFSQFLLDHLGLPKHLTHLLFPRQLDLLVQSLPHGYTASVKELMSEHTLLPYYAPFWRPDSAVALREQMQTGQGDFFPFFQAFCSLRQGTPYLRFCPMCVEEERTRLGEAYWHRAHQLPGVKVCLHHSCFLENSIVPTYSNLIRYVSADVACHHIAPRLVNANDHLQHMLIQIAQASAWLLDRGCVKGEITEVRERYLTLLRERGWATWTHHITGWSVVLNQFRQTYPDDFLRGLSPGFSLNIEYWLATMIRRNESKCERFEPLKHILLILLLQDSAERFFEVPSKAFVPFGDGPWPCLNVMCEHDHTDVILSCPLRRSNGAKGFSSAIGEFVCPFCGFTYLRRAPEKLPGERYRVMQYVAFGSKWNAELTRLWLDSYVTLKEIEHRLRVSSEVVVKQAQRLGLPFPRVCANWHAQRLVRLRRVSKKKKSNPQLRERYRTELLAARAQHPDWERNRLSNTYLRASNHLRANDREWFNANLPACIHACHYNRVGYWREHDASIAQAVRIKAKEVLDTNPLSPTMSKAMALNIAQFPRAVHCLGLMPQTVLALAEVVETTDGAALRRLRHVANQLRLEGRFAPRSVLHKMALVSHEVAGRSPILEEIVSLVNELSLNKQPR